jgi:hypothetical protein
MSDMWQTWNFSHSLGYNEKYSWLTSVLPVELREQLAHAVTLRTCVWKVTGSPQTQYLQENTGRLHHIRAQPLYSTSLNLRLITPSFDSVQSYVPRVSLNTKINLGLFVYGLWDRHSPFSSQSVLYRNLASFHLLLRDINSWRSFFTQTKNRVPHLASW